MSMKLKKFGHINATTVDEAVSALAQGNAMVNAGGTDLMTTLRFKILRDYPEVIVNLKTIPDLEYIKEEGGMLKIGALTKLEDIAIDSTIKSNYTALAQAAHRTASPHIREMGTIGGNICQLNRCWYFRKPNNRFDCVRKGGPLCWATAGDNRFQSIFGGVLACLAVNPSDTAPALVVLDASIVTSKRTINAEEFWAADKGVQSTVLDEDEIVTEIQVPTPASDIKSAFVKFAMRKSIDFPIVNCAAAIGTDSAKICLNAVFNNPHRATEAEESIIGKTIDEANADAAGTAAVSNVFVLPGNRNKWKVPITKTMVKRAILACK